MLHESIPTFYRGLGVLSRPIGPFASGDLMQSNFVRETLSLPTMDKASCLSIGHGQISERSSVSGTATPGKTASRGEKEHSLFYLFNAKQNVVFYEIHGDRASGLGG